MNTSESGQAGFYGLIASLIVAAAILAMSIVFVQFGTVKAVSFGGGLTGRLMQPGLNWKWPWEGTVEVVTLIRTYEASGTSGSSEADFTDTEVSAQTLDGQQIRISTVVRFKILPSDVIRVLETVGRMDRVAETVVRADTLSWIRKVAQQYTAAQLYSGDGVLAYEAEVQEILRASFSEKAVTIDALLIRKVDFAPAYVEAIERKQIAAENVRTQELNANAALHERDQKIALAEADARRIELVAEAQAEAIRLQGEALQLYPEMLRWQLVQALAGNVKFAFLPSDSIVPLLPMEELLK